VIFIFILILVTNW